MSDAFISYSRLDKEFVGRLREALADKGKDVWIDWESIPASQLWWQEIRKGIAKANNFVLIMSPNSMSSPICQMEIEYAREMGKRIIPVVYADYDRKACLVSIAERLATEDETATRDIWGARQAHDLYDANVAAIKPINYFFFKADADFSTRFDNLFTIIDTDPVYKESHTTLGLRAAEWDRRGRDASFLLLGNELTDAEQWREISTGKEPPPTMLQMDYINASRSASNRRRNIAISGVLIATAALVFAVGASLVGVNAVNQVATATIEQGKALAQADVAQQDAKNARTEVAVAGATLTSVPPVLTAVASALADAKVERGISGALSDAMLKIADNRPPEALKIVNSVVDNYPNKASAYLSRALVYTNTQQMDEAIADYNKALELDPNNADAYYNRGVLNGILNQHAKAIADYSKTLELDTGYKDAYFNRGNSYYIQKEYEKAAADFSSVIEIDPLEGSAYSNRGNAYRALGKYEEAMADYNASALLTPDNASVYYNLGNVYSDLKNTDEALAKYSKALGIDAHYRSAYVSRGNVYYGLGQYDKAVEDYSKAIELNADDADVYNFRGNVYTTLQQYDKATDDYSKAIELQADNIDLYLNRANAFYLSAQYERAIADYSKAIDLKPDDANIYGRRGIVFYLSAQYEQAIADYTTLLEFDPNNADAYYLRGTAYYAIKQDDRAISDFSRAIEINPQYADAYQLRGVVYYFEKQYVEALADWKQFEALGGTLTAEYEQYRAEAQAALNQTLTPMPTVMASATASK